MIKTRWVVLVWRIAAFSLVLCGLLYRLGAFAGGFEAESLLYYTFQTNLLVLLLFGYLVIRTALDMPYGGKAGNVTYSPRLHGAVTLSITLTFLVYWIALAPFDERKLFEFGNMSVHLITPLLCIADYIIIQEDGGLKKIDPFLFAIIPFVYFVQATIAGFCGVVYRVENGAAVRFPYYFMDYDKFGGWVAPIVLAITAAYIGLGYSMLLLDRKWKKPTLLPRSAMFGI